MGTAGSVRGGAEGETDGGLGKRCPGEKGRPLLGRLVGPPRGWVLLPGVAGALAKVHRDCCSENKLERRQW